MNRDLGTYYLFVEFRDGDGYYQKWETGQRFVGGGTGEVSPQFAKRIGPIYKDEDHLFECILYAYEDGNYSCDCNRSLFVTRAHNQEEADCLDCGETIILQRITAIRPDGTEHKLYEANAREQDESQLIRN